MQTFQVPGAAVALVQGNEIVFNRGFGMRNLASGEPVTPRTRFRIGSITKSMTALLLATLVDEGVFGWNDRAVDLWPAFQAPTPELTQTLHLRDLLGMASGIAESTELTVAAVEFFMSAGTVSAGDVLRSIAALPVIAPPDTTFSYNNSLYAAAVYLGLLAQGNSVREAGGDLRGAGSGTGASSQSGWLTRRSLTIRDPSADDYAVGYTRTSSAIPSPLPFVSLAGHGSGRLRPGQRDRYGALPAHPDASRGGARRRPRRLGVQSRRDAPARHRGRADRVVPRGASIRHHCPELLHGLAQRDIPRRPATALALRGNRWLLRLDGVLPRGAARLRLPHQRGARRWAVQPLLSGQSARSAVWSESGAAGFLAGAIPMLEARTAELAAQTGPVDPAAVTPYLGLYEEGFRLRLDDAGRSVSGSRHSFDAVAGASRGSYVVAARSRRGAGTAGHLRGRHSTVCRS